MANVIRTIALEKLVAHPGNPNRMSRLTFNKLVRNIERGGRYEPLVVRPHPQKDGCFEIINGHHRCKALSQLGHAEADCLVWEVDDEQVDILLATLNRLGGVDRLDKKLAILKRLSTKLDTKELGGLLPQTAKQIERLVSLQRPGVPIKAEAKSFANTLVFFLNDDQQQTVLQALSLAPEPPEKLTRAGRAVAGLVHLAQFCIENQVRA